ncbi:MAG: type II toxin-antitoxin system YoeB family toxin [Candidatus Methanomethylophilaceae archaeon]|nr:type II toxin-antitoxin system YoeB family toxin [Candidatus Methanomethylophilaceae archaeon]
MPEYIVKMYKTAENDYEELKRACQKNKIDSLLELISKDPFVTPPKYEELSGKYRGAYSRRINRKDHPGLRSERYRRS